MGVTLHEAIVAFASLRSHDHTTAFDRMSNQLRALLYLKAARLLESIRGLADSNKWLGASLDR